MIEQLPSWGAFMAAVQGGSEFRGWTPDTYLSADIWDATQYLMIKGSKKRRIDNPYPRPGSGRSKPKEATLDEALPF